MPTPASLSSHVAAGGTSQSAFTVVKKDLAKRRVAQHLLTDNGSVLDTSGRCREAQLSAYVASFGVTAIPGEGVKRTKQGKECEPPWV